MPRKVERETIPSNRFLILGFSMSAYEIREWFEEVLCRAIDSTGIDLDADLRAAVLEEAGNTWPEDCEYHEMFLSWADRSVSELEVYRRELKRALAIMEELPERSTFSILQQVSREAQIDFGMGGANDFIIWVEGLVFEKLLVLPDGREF